MNHTTPMHYLATERLGACMPEQHIDNEKIPTRLIGAIVAVGSLA